MPPRVQQITNSIVRICPNALNIVPQPVGPSRSLLLAFQSLTLHTSAPRYDVGEKYGQKRVVYNPYAIAKAKLIRERNIARQEELIEQRNASNADPVLGNPTPFTELLDSAPVGLPSIDVIERSGMELDRLNDLEDKSQPNYFLTKVEIKSALDQSKALTFPPPPQAWTGSIVDEHMTLEHAQHAHSAEAIKRITSLALGSSKDKTRSNKQLCIELFGRHNTDNSLPPDPAQEHSSMSKLPKQFEKTPRVGPDTGSSEVQAAILTVKIRALVDHLKTNKKDKMNQRNLRLLCHRRQKHLRYLKRKEKGGVRYRNIMEQLGLDEHAIESELMM